MRKVAIIASGMCKVDRHWGLSLKELFSRALEDATKECELPKIDAVIIGNMCGVDLSWQNNIAPLVADYSGFSSIPAFRVENACASGASALLAGYLAVASGIHDYVLVGGVEKLTEGVSSDITLALAKAADAETEIYYGASFVSLNALLMRMYMERFNVDRHPFAQFSSLMHRNASKNPYAQLPFEISVENILRSEPIADPITLYDCAPIGDGAAVVVLAPLDEAFKHSDSIVELAGIWCATDTIDVASREDPLFMRSTFEASRNACKMAGISVKDAQVLEVHDTFTITGFLSLESLGLLPPGGSPTALEEGVLSPGGTWQINLSGGLKARGHPVGATGVYQAAEIHQQLIERFPGVKASPAEIGLTQNVGGVGSISVVAIYRRVK
ncbi:MAG: acetyl-CoA acetyltransferase [Candidatus Verstraetearchaeota archaeon]|nr:acetyl-CoA acetyltransferase [Candidatus Verstraetearchaeota archaeon]